MQQQQFQFLTQNDKIKVFSPYNPFAQGIVERINAYPVEQQAQVMKDILESSHVSSTLSVVGVNAEYNVVLYSLTLTRP